MIALRRLIADARVHAPRELAELPQVAGGFGLCLLVLAIAWVMVR